MCLKRVDGSPLLFGCSIIIQNNKHTHLSSLPENRRVKKNEVNMFSEYALGKSVELQSLLPKPCRGWDFRCAFLLGAAHCTSSNHLHAQHAGCI